MKNSEQKSVVIIASIYAFRMLGLFMILPIFSLYAEKFSGATPTLIGFALGIYGLSQGILQIPFGMCSDYVGRKPVIIFGLVLFLLGSLIAAFAHSIEGIIWGRALQGAGAIGSTLIALVADTTDEENRLKAMAVIGMTIGATFILAMVIGPFLNSVVGLSGVFFFTAILAGLGIIMIHLIPTPKKNIHPEAEPILGQFKTILLKPELLRLDLGIFCLHAILTAVFMVIPVILTRNMNLSMHMQWLLYIPILVVACLIMVPFIIIAEKKRVLKPIFLAAIVLLTWCAVLLDIVQNSIFMLTMLLCLFFAAFTFLEASLPSLVSKIAPIRSKGTAMGIYSSAQFLGIFFGGSFSGILLSNFGDRGIFMFCGILGITWVILAVTMKVPPYLSTHIMSIKNIDAEQRARLNDNLRALPGVHEVMLCPEEDLVYLKVDKKDFSQEQAEALLT